MQTTSSIIDKNWKALIKPNKLEITSNEDKTIAKVRKNKNNPAINLLPFI